MRKRKETKAIVVHHSASGYATSIDDIRAWHTTPTKYGGRGWEDIGYHFVLPASGEIQMGRPEDMEGTQVANFNDKSIGICLLWRDFVKKISMFFILLK